MKRITKKIHTYFIKNLTRELLVLGAVGHSRSISYSELKEYSVTTIVGELLLYPDYAIPIGEDRFRCYGLTCFARFSDSEAAWESFGGLFSNLSRNGKMNFHFGHVGSNRDADECITCIINRIKYIWIAQ